MDSGSDVDGNKPVDRAINRLKTFLTSNPSSKIEERDADDDTVVVKSPWGDDTIEIVIPDEDDGLWSALNSLILPPRFSAIYHVDYKKLEIIYSAFPLDDAQKEVVIRSFDFEFDGKTYRCRFGKSSEKLMVIAEHTKYIGMGYTQHRNMLSFTYYVTAQKDSEKSSKIAGIEPISFWIDDIDWNEDNLVRLSRHLSFCFLLFLLQLDRLNMAYTGAKVKPDSQT